MTGGSARDCGRHADTASESALLRSLQCAQASARAGEPFTVIVQSTRDATAGFGLQGTGDTVVQVFRYDRGGWGGVVFRAEPCAASRRRWFEPRPTGRRTNLRVSDDVAR